MKATLERATKDAAPVTPPALAAQADPLANLKSYCGAAADAPESQSVADGNPAISQPEPPGNPIEAAAAGTPMQ